MLDTPIDASAYFRALDREIAAMFRRLKRHSQTRTKAEELTRNISRSLIRRSRLFDNIVLPTLRRTKTSSFVIDLVEQDQQALWLLAEDMIGMRVDDRSFNERIKKLAGRFYDCTESDETTLWPAARASGVDLVSIANRLMAASYDEVPSPSRPFPTRNGQMKSPLDLSSAPRGESHAKRCLGRDCTAQERSPRGRGTIHQSREGRFR